MTEDAALEEQQVDEPAVAEPENTKPESDKPKPEGWDRVDFTKIDDPELREQIESRFHRLYGQVKRNDAAMKQMADDQRKLYEKLENWEVGQANQNVSSQISQLQAQWEKAFEAGESKKAWAVQREMAKLEAQAAAHANRAPQKQHAEPSTDAIPQYELEEIASWAAERPHTQEGSKYQRWIGQQINDLYTDPDWADKPIEAKLAEVDKRFTAKTRPTGQEVLSSTGKAQNNKAPKLSDAEKTVAKRMFSDMKPEEAYARYARGKE